jgi:hypothetical protein
LCALRYAADQIPLVVEVQHQGRAWRVHRGRSQDLNEGTHDPRLVVEAALGAEMGLKRRIESLDVVVFEPNVRIGWLRWYRFLGSG